MMTSDDRDVPLDEFETTMLAELFSAQTLLNTTTAGGNIALAPARRRRRVITAVAGVPPD